jgi:4-amino-4-deoxy-L-arabinose transferase-like glycosyltransferase
MSTFIVSRWRWIAALAFLFLLARLRTAFVEVLDTDETIFHTVAARMLAGERLYVDVYDIKPPGIYLFYAGIQWLFGPGLYAVHHVTTLVVAATAWVIARAARAASGDRDAGLLAAAVYLAFHGVGDAGTGASSSTEQLAALPVTGAMSMLLGRASPPRALLAGALLGIAVLFKPQAGAAALAALVALALRGEKRLLSCAALPFGAGVPLLATWAAFASVGLGDAMLRWSFLEGIVYASSGAPSPLREVPNLLAYLALHLVPLVLAAMALQRCVQRFSRALLGVWLVLALLAAASGLRFYWNYFVLISPPLAILAGVGGAALWARVQRRARAALAVIVLLPSLGSQAWLAFAEREGRGSLRAGHRELAREALRLLAPTSRLVAFGSAAPIYYATGTSPPTPFLVTDHLFGYLDPNLIEDPDGIRGHAHAERLSHFLAVLGQVDVLVDAPFSAWRGYSLERLPELAARVRARFRVAYRGKRGAVWVADRSPGGRGTDRRREAR